MRDEEDVAVKHNWPCRLPGAKVLVLNHTSMKNIPKYILGKISDYWITDKKPDPDLIRSRRQSNDFYMMERIATMSNIRLIISDIRWHYSHNHHVDEQLIEVMPEAKRQIFL